MKALQTTPTPNANHSHERVRSAMTLTGIVTVILCFVALLQEPRSMGRMGAGAPRLLETSKIVAADLLAEAREVLGY